MIKEYDHDSYWDKSALSISSLIIDEIVAEYSYIFKLILDYKIFYNSYKKVAIVTKNVIIFVTFASQVQSIALPLLCFFSTLIRAEQMLWWVSSFTVSLLFLKLLWNSS